MYHKPAALVFSMLVCAASSLLSAAPGNLAPEAPRDLFSSDEVLDLELSVDFDAMCRPNEDEGCEFAPATLTYRAADDAVFDMPTEIRVRGGWRARRDHCDVPPLFVRFLPGGAQGTPFAGQDLLPLTTHCRSAKRVLGGVPSKEYEQYVLREYLGYRLYNMLSDLSLRVRLVRISYRDPSKGGKQRTRYAFFTEHFDEMAARDDAVALYTKSFDPEKIDLASMDRIALYSFMIGNTDWSIPRQRNIVLIVTADGSQYPVPFDMDMSGLVDAEYAGVSPRLDFRDVRKRYYLGFCHPQLDLEPLFADFWEHEEAFQELMAETPGFNRSSRKHSRTYIKKFFQVLASPQKSQEDIIEACHPWPPAAVDHTTPPDETVH